MKFRTAPIIAIGFGSLLLVGYLSLPYVITRIAKNYLFQNGMHLARLDIDHVDAWNARINSLEIVLDESRGKQGPIKHIVLQDIRLGYQLDDLINKKLVSVDIKHAIVSGVATKQGQTSTSNNSSLLLPSKLMKSLPMDRLTIENVEFEWQAGVDKKDRYYLVGDLKYNKGELETNLSIDGIKGKRIGLTLSVNQKDQLNIKVYPAQSKTREMIKLQSQLEEKEDEISLSGRVSVDVKSLVAEVSRFELDKSDKFSRLINTIEIKDIVELEFMVTPEHIKVKGNIKLYGDHVNTHIEAQHNFNTLNGLATIVLDPFSFSRQTRVLSSMITPWEYPFDITSGEFSGKMEITWVQKGKDINVEKKYRFKAKNLSGFYDENIFIGLNAEGDLEDIHGLKTLRPVKVNISEINSGFAVKSISFRVNYVSDKRSKDPVFYLHDVVGNAFEGKLYSSKILFDASKEKNSFIVNLKGLSIKKLLELDKQQEIDGTGVIDGHLPIVMTSQGLSILEGKLEAREPGGIIQYQPEQLGQLSVLSDPNVNLVMEALQNFHYQVLKSDIDYTPDGKLVLTLKLEGRNPEMKTRRPVHLNVNVEQNILTLLKSLRLADDIGEKIGESFKK